MNLNLNHDSFIFAQLTDLTSHQLTQIKVRYHYYETNLLNYAIMCEKIDVVAYLLKKGANPNWKNERFFYFNLMIETGYSALHRLVQAPIKNETQLAILKLLFQYGVNPNLQEKEGQTAFHFLVEKPFTQTNQLIGKHLLRNGADLSIKDNLKKTSIDYARSLKQTEWISWFSSPFTVYSSHSIFPADK